jgi:hypothetical protein
VSGQHPGMDGEIHNSPVADCPDCEDPGPYRCTWAQTGYAYGIYVNNGQNCEKDGVPLRLDGTCPKCGQETE